MTEKPEYLFAFLNRYVGMLTANWRSGVNHDVSSLSRVIQKSRNKREGLEFQNVAEDFDFK